MGMNILDESNENPYDCNQSDAVNAVALMNLLWEGYCLPKFAKGVACFDESAKLPDSIPLHNEYHRTGIPRVDSKSPRS